MCIPFGAQAALAFLLVLAPPIRVPALDVPDIDSHLGLAHTLFALEDIYGLGVGELDGEVCLRLEKSRGTTYIELFDLLKAWQKQAAKLAAGEITKEDYDRWRYRYPEFDTENIWGKIPSEEFGDAVQRGVKKRGQKDE